MAHSFSFLSDREGRLLAASGDTSFTGVDEEEVDAKPLFSLFAVDDRATVVAALKKATAHAEIELPELRILSGGDLEAAFDVTIQPAGPDKFWILFVLSPNQPGPLPPSKKEDFLSAVAERLGVPDAPAMQMIMLDFEALRDADLKAKLGEQTMQDVRSSIEGALTEVAVDGQVSRLGATSYGVLSPVDQDSADMIATVAEATEQFGVGEEDLGTAVERVELDAEADAEADDLRGLLSHAAHKFYQTVRNGTPFGASKISEVS